MMMMMIHALFWAQLEDMDVIAFQALAEHCQIKLIVTNKRPCDDEMGKGHLQEMNIRGVPPCCLGVI